MKIFHVMFFCAFVLSLLSGNDSKKCNRKMHGATKPNMTNKPSIGVRVNKTEKPTEISSKKNQGNTTSNHSRKYGALTRYQSYPDCCVKGFQGDKTECTEYSGCKYAGQFACLEGQKSKEWVAQNNIVAVYDNSDQKGANFKKRYCNKKVKLSKALPSGDIKSFVATIVDTCGNGDCDGCCTKNSKNGFLFDLERNTAKRNFGSETEAHGTISYEFL